MNVEEIQEQPESTIGRKPMKQPARPRTRRPPVVPRPAREAVKEEEAGQPGRPAGAPPPEEWPTIH